MPEDGLVRVNVRVSKILHDDMLTVIPWGLRRYILEAVLKLVLDAVKRDGQVVAGAILDGRFKLVRVETEGSVQNLNAD